MRISYVNGRFVPHRKATVHIEDRGYLFSDGVYEVMAYYNGKLLDRDRHLRRLAYSLKEMRLTTPVPVRKLTLLMQKLIDRNAHTHGTLYLQISRGVAKRDHPFPKGAKPSLVMMVTPPKTPKKSLVEQGVSVITMPDIRWGRRDIKSISLLPNILAKQAASEAGAREAWLMNDKGQVIEGCATNNFIVSAKGEILTHPKTHAILGGITREVVLELARKHQFKAVERAFTLKEVMAAKEAFLTSTTSNILPVIRVDGKKIGDGKPGKTTLALLTLYHDHIRRQTGKAW